ncbi:glycoside hydrolase family 9 protein [Nonlabens xiamenensis]|uniref:glycoside hydrolase family 9 protein n=1 Tax=Nonlabens xiamenensis TaxID=2341043 RepID=UPI000F60D7EA|nr:glycoside hydrolase family 9 protein [Nonlabens xiamenensis]
MKNITLCLLSLFGLMSTAQVVYSDHFDGSSQISYAAPGYSTTTGNSVLTFSGNGTAGAFAPVIYSMGSSIDIASSPKLFIRVKSSTSVDLRIDLQDQTGYVTNLNSSSVQATSTYQEFEINYTGKLQDGGYGGPCSSSMAPCAVDSSNITDLVFFVNAAQGGFNGNIEIDWISFGESLNGPAPTRTHYARYNQIGYFTGQPKTISLVYDTQLPSIDYDVFDASGTSLLSGTTSGSSYWSEARFYVTQIDISGIDTPGDYRFVTAEEDVTFTVAEQPYLALSEAALKYYYFNRASTAITTTHGGQYARPFGLPDTQVRIHSSAADGSRQTGDIISSPGGWYDAGDYNKYVVNSGISTYTLLASYEHYPAFHTNYDINIPESGDSMPDVLDEAAYNIDWMLTMQDLDGGVYHKLTGLNFSGIIMPDAYNLNRYVVQKTTAATLNFAAVMAQASRIYAAFPNEKPGYSAILQQAAENAYTWAKNNPTTYYNQPSDVTTGQYGDGNMTDEFFWAACELFITTGQSQYLNDIDLNDANGSVPGWPNVATLGMYSLLTNSATVGSSVNLSLVGSKLTTQANSIRSRINNSVMEIGMGSQDYFWGSNGGAANQIMLLLNAYQYTNDNSYLSAAYKGMDYLLGRNGTGYCMVTGFGDQRVLAPHHRISEADAIADPVPGMLAGGPHSLQPDGCNYPSTAPARSYSDTWCSYSTNEVTINWNAPLFYTSSALEYHQTLATLSTDQAVFEERFFKIYPNPVGQTLHFKSNHSDVSPTIEIFQLNSSKVREVKIDTIDSTIDVSNLTPGMYIIKAKYGDEQYVEKLIKH